MSASQSTPEDIGDKAMGIELMAIEVENQIEWAEKQGRTTDAVRLTAQLSSLLGELADVAESIPAAA